MTNVQRLWMTNGLSGHKDRFTRLTSKLRLSFGQTTTKAVLTKSEESRRLLQEQFAQTVYNISYASFRSEGRIDARRVVIDYKSDNKT